MRARAGCVCLVIAKHGLLFPLVFAPLSGDNEVPRVDTVATGRAAVTLNTATGALVVQAQVDGLDGASAAHVHDGFAGENGPVLVGLTQDGSDPGHWFVEDGALSAAGIEGFLAGGLYVNVHSPANPGGEIRGQVIPDGIELLVPASRRCRPWTALHRAARS